ncbi:MAG TPA: hypothetical protein VHE81_20045 [Lacipirellulaceae bacterium]|nr:hypothetical protein [Lacipirellulaceae bacterium]
MLQVMRDIGGVEIPASLAKLAGDDGVKAEGNGHVKAAGPATASNGDEEVATGAARS